MKLIGVDIGTTTISGVVYDSESQKVVASRTIGNDSFILTEDEWERIQDPEKIVERAYSVLEELLESYPDVESIGLTGQMHGILYLNSMGKSVSPLYTWQDPRGDFQVMNEQSPVEHVKSHYPNMNLAAGYGLATHLYLQACGKLPEDAVSMCTIPDYLGMCLTGSKTPITHASMAASMGLFDVKEMCFQKEILREYGMNLDLLPEVTDEIKILGNYEKEGRSYPVTAAIGDNQASFLGTVGMNENAVLLNVGTGSQISVISRECPALDAVEVRPFLDGTYLLAGSALCGGRAYAILENFFRIYVAEVEKASGKKAAPQYEILNRLAQMELDPSEEMIVDTTFQGTRKMPHLRGSVRNISEKNFTPQGMVQGVLHGILRELHEYYEEMTGAAELHHSTIVASGNGMRRNPALLKFSEQEFGMKAELSDCLEEAACGAAKSTQFVCR
ncbi:MAG: FGGY family carbohydrate kinase [Eubacteriales bacterium]|nr:FGGY family carbohydrate kinase [Eubacteriales bacterium]